MKFSDRVGSRDNNFDFIRLVAATMVLVNHTFALSGSGYDPFLPLLSAEPDSYETLGGLGVNIFFIISGFLITNSWVSRPNIGEFIVKRSLRILPALAASTFFCVFVVGLSVTSLDHNAYFLNPETWVFLLNVFLYKIYIHLPGVFKHNPFNSAVNGSLWTLTIEAYCYCIVAAFGVLGLISKRAAPMILAACFIALDVFIRTDRHYASKVMLNMVASWAVKCFVFFMMGATIYAYSDRIPFNGYMASAMLLAYVLSWTLHMEHFGSYFTSYFTLPYLVLYVGFSKLPLINNLGGKIGDYSYGVYVYAFPVQQTVMFHANGNLGRGVFFIISLTFTLALAFLSWRLVEKPALGLKKYVYNVA